jgi:hypothetical protein
MVVVLKISAVDVVVMEQVQRGRFANSATRDAARARRGMG